MPFQQSESFVDKLKKAGVSAKLVPKEGADHGWPTILDDMGTMVDWYDVHLAPKAEKKGPDQPRK